MKAASKILHKSRLSLVLIPPAFGNVATGQIYGQEAETTMYVLIADDHANVRRGLREIVADAFSGAQFSEAANADEVLTQLARSQYGALLLDINMPGRSGLDVLQDVRHMYPKLPVIMVSVQPENQYAARCLRAGASAYVNKNSASEELVPAIRKVMGQSSAN